MQYRGDKQVTIDSRYELHYGMNPVSAMCWRIWDKWENRYVKSRKYSYSEEFLSEQDARREVEALKYEAEYGIK